MLVTKTAINVIGEIAKKGYLIINKNCKSDLQNSESLFYLKIFLKIQNKSSEKSEDLKIYFSNVIV